MYHRCIFYNWHVKWKTLNKLQYSCSVQGEIRLQCERGKDGSHDSQPFGLPCLPAIFTFLNDKISVVKLRCSKLPLAEVYQRSMNLIHKMMA